MINVILFYALWSICPILISDQTPCRDLKEKGIGWDLPFGKPEVLRMDLQRCVDMNDGEYMKWSERARAYGFRVSQDDEGGG